MGFNPTHFTPWSSSGAFDARIPSQIYPTSSWTPPHLQIDCERNTRNKSVPRAKRSRRGKRGRREESATRKYFYRLKTSQLFTRGLQILSARSGRNLIWCLERNREEVGCVHSPLTGTEPFLQAKLTLVGQWQTGREAAKARVEIYLQEQVQAQIPLGIQQPPGPKVLIYLLMHERNKKHWRRGARNSWPPVPVPPLALHEQLATVLLHRAMHFSCK